MRFLFLLLFIPLLAVAPHKYYVSTTEMYFKPDKDQLQLVVRVFTDDFETALSQFSNQSIRLDPDNTSKTGLDSLMTSYFNNHFVFYELPAASQFSFVGWEYKQDQTVMYASYDGLESLTKLAWSNTFLMDVFPDQKNIVILSSLGKKKSFLHTREQEFATFNFKIPIN